MGKKQTARRRYSDDFKQQAVERAIQPRAVVQKVADELGFSAAVFHNWILKFRASQPSMSVQEELEKLRYELKEAKMDSEIKEKAKKIWERFHKVYGRARISNELANEDIVVGNKRRYQSQC